MKIRILMILIVLWFIGAATTLVSAEEKKLMEYPFKETLALLEKGGKNLIERHGEEMLEMMYLREITKKMEDPSEPQLLRNKKTDFPVYKALKSGGESTLSLLKTSKFFIYPRSLGDQEFIAFLLLELVGRESSICWADSKISVAKNYEKTNWVKIRSLLNDPDLSKGLFYYEDRKNATKDANQISLQIQQMKELSKLMDELDFQKILAAHCKFNEILSATLHYKSQEDAWPSSLFLLSQKKLIELECLQFSDSNGFSLVPKIARKINEKDALQIVLYLDIPDSNFLLEGRVDGVINLSKRPPDE